MRIVIRVWSLLTLMVMVVIMGESATAATATTSFTARITITSQCKVVSATDLDFGSNGVLDANVDATSTITVACTNTTPYNIQLNAGSTAGGSIATRKMTDGSNSLDYRMYRDSARVLNWGQSNGVDTLSDTGTGAAQVHTVYGRVPAQTTPAPGAYIDTVTVTVEY